MKCVYNNEKKVENDKRRRKCAKNLKPVIYDIKIDLWNLIFDISFAHCLFFWFYDFYSLAHTDQIRWNEIRANLSVHTRT